MRRTRAIFTLLTVCAALSGLPSPSTVLAKDEVVTFFATSDSHYEAVQNVDRNERNLATIERMNALPGTPWPAELGGGKIGRPGGVCVLGDLIDDGDKAGETEIEWRHFEEQFGLDGTDGRLHYPTFEGWGNHDGPPAAFIKHGFSLQAQLKRRNQTRREKGWLSNVSENGLHYSWDWGGVHLVQMNLYPADRQHPKVRYSLPWHDPQGALAFLKDDLRDKVGRSGRPVIVMAHCGFDTDWWVADDWKAFYQAVKGFNLITYVHGHSGTGIKKWKPEGEELALDIVNTGQTEKGFFVVEVSHDRLRVAFQYKQDPKETKDPEWAWKYLLEKPISWPEGAGNPCDLDEPGPGRKADQASR